MFKHRDLPNTIDYKMQNAVGDLRLEETIFSHVWQSLVEHKSEKGIHDTSERLNVLYYEVLAHSNLAISQHNVFILNTLATWLGTSVGMSVLLAGKQNKQDYPLSDNAYLFAWVAKNRRISGINRGLRLLECIFLNKYPINDTDPIIIPNLTLQDYEIAEAFFYWLGTESGRTFALMANDWIRSIRNTSTKIFNGRTFEDDDAESIATILRKETALHDYHRIGYVDRIAQTAISEFGIETNDRCRLLINFDNLRSQSLIFSHRTRNTKAIDNDKLIGLFF